MIAIFAQQIVLGLLLGALYGLATVGLALVFGVMKVLNVSHGELIMFGGYASFWLLSLYGVDPYLSIFLSMLILFLMGVGLQKGLFVHVTKLGEAVRIKNSLLIGFGLGLIMHNLAILFWTADERSITPAYAGLGTSIFGVVLPLTRVGGLFVAVLAIAILHYFLNRTYLGKSIRATAEDWESATLMGIDIQKTYLVSFALGCALAGVAGTLVGVGYYISPAIGLEWTLKSLIVIVLAGLGSISGIFLGGLLLGVAEALGGFFIGMIYRDLVALILFFSVLLFKPEGLFARRMR